MTTTAAPDTTNKRTRAIEPVLHEHGLRPWMGGRTTPGSTEHGVWVPEGKTVADVQAAVVELGWAGVSLGIEGTNPRRKRMGDAYVVWIRVPR